MAGKDYMAIARQKIRRPSESKRMPRMLVYSRNKKGKTRFCTTAPNVLFLDPEDGTREELKANPQVWPMDSWDDANEFYHYLKLGKHPYKWIAIDGLTRIANIALRWVTRQEEERDLDRKPNDVRIQDYGRAGEMVSGFLSNLHSLRDIGIVITCQERMVEVVELGESDEDAEPTTYMFVPDLPKKSRSTVVSMVDLIGRMYIVKGEFVKRGRHPETKEVVEKHYTEQRRLWVGPHNMYETGYRSQFQLPDYITDPTVPSVIKAMREGKVTR